MINKKLKSLMKNKLGTPLVDEWTIPVKVDTKLCNSCGTCASCCPVGAISVEDGKAAVIFDYCVACGTCVDYCPIGAISFIGNDY